MNKLNKFLYWLPRVLGILFSLFMSLFALDVFTEGYTLSQVTIAFFIHLLPVYVLIIALLIAWKREVMGGLIFIFLGTFFIIRFSNQDFLSYLIISGCLFLIGLLFILSKFFKRKIILKDNKINTDENINNLPVNSSSEHEEDRSNNGRSTIFFISILFVAVICTSCTLRESQTPSILSGDTTQEGVENKEESDKAPGKEETVFTSSRKCLSACHEAGYELGQCMWPELEAGPLHHYLGTCLIDTRQRHCGGTRCSCYCYSSTTPPVQH